MGNFKTPLVVKHLDGENWELDEEFEYYVGRKEDNDLIKVPKGFITDFASIPKVVWSIIGHPAGQYGKAAVIHDYLYRNGLRTRKKADDIFLEAMEVLGVGAIRRRVIYSAVRLFGCLAYKKKD